MKIAFRRSLTCLGLAVLAAGCASPRKAMHRPASPTFSDAVVAPTYEGAPATARAGQDRMLAWKASLFLDVRNVSNAVVRATALAEKEGGYVEYRSGDGAGNASLKLRIPRAAFLQTVGSLEALGTATYRQVENEDVTEQFVDVEARLKNRIVLRDRLRKLLDQATEVKDVLAIESELNRVQGDVDSMEARIKSLQGRVDFAVLDLQFHRKPVLGPLGVLFKGLFWTVGKLFVLRD